MRILYIASVRIPNEKASGLAIMRQCEAFASLGHDVTIVRPFRTNHLMDDPFSYYGIEKTFKVHTLPSIDFKQRLGVLGFYIARLSQMVTGLFYLIQNRKRVDVIYARDPWMLMLSVLFFRGTNIIWEAHQAQKGMCVAFVAKRARLLVCITGGLRDFYIEMGREGKTIVEPSGVNLDQFKDLPSVAEVRDVFSVPKNKKVIGYIGKYKTMGESKGVDELIEAFGVVYAKNQNTHLLIVGLEDAETKVVCEVCTRYKLPESAFTLLPLVQKDFAQYVQIADVLVMNYPNTEHYRKYMSPTKLFAYMGSRKAVVASDLPSVREIVDDSMVTLVNPDDVDSLRGGIMFALRNDDNTKIQASYNRVLQLTWKERGGRIFDFNEL